VTVYRGSVTIDPEDSVRSYEDTDLICERAVQLVGYLKPGESREEADRKHDVYMAACAVGNWELAAEDEREAEYEAERKGAA
jgi:hypothetical protein